MSWDESRLSGEHRGSIGSGFRLAQGLPQSRCNQKGHNSSWRATSFGATSVDLCPGGIVFASCRTASLIRRQTAAPACSPAAREGRDHPGTAQTLAATFVPLERTCPRHEPRTMRLFGRRLHPLIPWQIAVPKAL
jgi:hypothetical protein